MSFGAGTAWLENVPAVAGIVIRFLERRRVGVKPCLSGGLMMRGYEGRHEACPYGSGWGILLARQNGGGE